MKHVKRLIVITIILLIYSLPIYSITDYTGDGLWVNINTSINVSLEGTVFIEGNLYCNEAPFNSNGHVTVNSTDLSQVTLPSEITGDGVLDFEGSGDFDVTSQNDFSVANFIVNTDGDVVLRRNFSVSKQLQLLNGVVEVDYDKVLLVESDDENSLIFDESDYNKSYVIGYLGRNVNSDNTYYYTIGGNDGAYPLYVAEPESPGVFVAKYDKDIAANASSTNIPGINFLSESGWHVYAVDATDNQFTVGLWAPEQFTVNNPTGIFHSETYDFLEYNKIWSCVNNYQSFLRSGGKTSVGYFTLIEKDLKLRNFFLVGNGNETLFEIPDALKYSNIKLTLYNRLGTKLFQADSYQNQLDLRDYPTGTYYYELILTEDSNTQKIYNFIEVKNEKY